jgi:tetratricopeptide (TPR) repeat protein
MKFLVAGMVWVVALQCSMGQDLLLDGYYKGYYDEVIETASVLISTGDSTSYPYFMKALSEIQLGKVHKAIATLKEARLRFPGEQRFLTMLAGQYFEAGAYQEAGILYESMVTSDPTDLVSLLRLSEIRAFGQQYKASLLLLRQLLTLDSTHLKALMMTGDILTRLEDTTAVVYYEEAFRLYPENQQAAYSLGNWYIQTDHPDRAIPVCEQVLEQDSTHIRFQKLLGLALYRDGKPASAIDHLERAASLGDSTSFTFKYLGISLFLASDFTGAIPALKMALRKDSLDAESHFFLGASLANTTFKQEAMHHLEMALQLMNPDPAAVARIYAEQGNLLRLEMAYDKAYRHYQLSWEADTTNPMGLYYMASILDNSLHRSRAALVDYQRFLDQLDRKPETLKKNDQIPTLRQIVEERIVMLKEELFFLDGQ